MFSVSIYIELLILALFLRWHSRLGTRRMAAKKSPSFSLHELITTIPDPSIFDGEAPPKTFAKPVNKNATITADEIREVLFKAKAISKGEKLPENNKVNPIKLTSLKNDVLSITDERRKAATERYKKQNRRNRTERR